MAERNPTIVFPEPKRAVVEDRPMPAPGPGEVLVKTRRSLISTGTELTIFSGEFPPNSFWSGYGKFPFVAGYSNAGLVTAVGAGVDPGLQGKRVASFRAHAAYVTVNAADAYVIPDGLPDEQAAFFSLSLIVMNGVRLAELQWGEAVVVFGTGLIGQFCARFCALSGARPVIGVDVAPARLALLPEGPAFARVNGKREDAGARVSALTRGRMAEVVFECTGNHLLIPGQFALLKRPRGRFIVLSSPRGPSTFDFHDLVNAPSHVIIGAHQMSTPEHETPYNQWTKRRNTELFFDLVKSGELALAPLISHRYPAAKGPDAYRMLLEDRSGAMGVVLDWEA